MATRATPASGFIDRVLGAPASLREVDLLSVDQPLKPYPPLQRWRYNAGIRALIYIAAFVLGTTLLGLVVGVIMTAMGADVEQITAFIGSWATPLSIPIMLLAYWLVSRFWEQRRPVHELSARTLVRGALVGLALGTAFMLASVGLLALVGVYRIEGLSGEPFLWGTILVVGFAAGIVEELLFRGVLYRLLEDTFGSWAAIGISALFFGLVHLGNSNATWQGAIGIALEAGLLFAALYAFTRNLWLVMGVHFAWNVVQGPILGIVVSGSTDGGQGILRSTMNGPELISGGAFGAEASIITIVLLTSAGVWLMVELARRGLIVQPSWVRRRALQARASVPALAAADAPATEAATTDSITAPRQ